MLTVLRESSYFARNQFRPLFQIALLYTVPSLGIELMLTATDTKLEGIAPSLINGLFLCLGVLQFGAAILCIHAKVLGTPITATRAIGLATERLGALLIVNLLMAVLVGGGLMLLVIPGLFFAYKLLFAELFLLLGRQTPIESLKSSYQATTGLASVLLPPLLVWGAAVIGASLLSLAGASEQDPSPLALAMHHLLMAGLSIWGWALIYRLYQQHIASPDVSHSESED